VKTVSGIPVGSHTVTLLNAATNCSVAFNGFIVSVSAGATSDVYFQLNCWYPG
jgi:hypothetical protein